MFPTNHKTVFVLDHTPYFGIPSGNNHDFDYLMQNPNELHIHVPPISKPLWTCCVETVIEYCRIAWDLFPVGKLLRFISSDHIANLLNNWDQQTQTIVHVSNAMSLIGGPSPTVPPNVDVNNLSVIHGLRAGIESLSELTDLQRKYIESNPDVPLQNNARLICITCARDDESIKGLVDIFVKVLDAQNGIARKNTQQNTHGNTPLTNTGHAINYCHLVIVNVGPNNTETLVRDQSLVEIHPCVSYEVHSIKAKQLHVKFSHLIQNHYNLTSTTITGIPMKEEQSSASSANYDVEIYHEGVAHNSIHNDFIIDTSLIKAFKAGNDYETITLRWCTPRGYSTSDMLDCTAVVRFTTVDVNSRPSTCLTNFLLNGRSVMLETPRKNGKIISHLLTSHGGELFVHALNIGRTVLEDMPSISEGIGGKVTDYRITEFSDVMKRNRLFPSKNAKSHDTHRPFTYGLNKDLMPLNNSIKKLDFQTKYWPLTYSSTLIYNLKEKEHIPKLHGYITKDTLTDEEVLHAKQLIWELIGMEAENAPLALNTAVIKFKGQRREDQYKFLWTELETLFKTYLLTDNHKAIYNCMLQSRKGTGLEGDFVRTSVIRATTDSPLSPPGVNPVHLKPTNESSTTLFDWYVEMLNKKIKQRPIMNGRKAGNKFKLYQDLEDAKIAAMTGSTSNGKEANDGNGKHMDKDT